MVTAVQIENPWVVYEINNVARVGLIVGEYPSSTNPSSVDLVWASFHRHPETYLTRDLIGRFAKPSEAIACAAGDHDGGARGIIRGSDRDALVKLFREESFKGVKLE